MNKQTVVILGLICCLLRGYTSLNAQDPWLIEAKGFPMETYHGVMVGNGMLGLISSQEPLKNSMVITAGTYDKYGRGGVSNYFPSIDFLAMELKVDGVSVSISQITSYSQCLDMLHGSFEGKFSIPERARVNYAFRALRHLPHCALLSLDITPTKDIEVTLTNRHRTPDALREGVMRHNVYSRSHAQIDMISTDAVSPTGKVKLTASSSFILPEGVKVISTDHRASDNDSHFLRHTVKLSKGQSVRFGLIGTLITSIQHPDPSAEADRLTLFASLQGVSQLIKRHEQEWADLWEGDILIEGDSQTQQDVHAMLYHLYCSVNEDLPECGVSPMGLSGLGYNGHVFWDADIWMMPVLAALHPKIAQRMVEYRFNRIEAACRNARFHGYKGAMFPWESSDTGSEETPVWALTGTFEHHISGCVAYSAWLSYLATQDLKWLRDKVWPILKETADFWVSRIAEDAQGNAHIRNVVCADEWAENVDDNAFTNGVAMTNLQIALHAADLLNLPASSQWAKYAHSLPLLHFADGTIREHATYKGESIKQADVNLLAYPLHCVTDTAQILRDLAYYRVRVPQKNTPAMTQAIFSLLYARLGMKDEAMRYLYEAYLPNLCTPFRTLAEYNGGDNPYFLTGAGGVLQALVMGFGGYDFTDSGLRQLYKPLLPDGWSSFKVTFGR